MSLLQRALNPTGGLRYHARAWRYRKSLWRPFREGVQQWLASWNPPEKRLLIIGPSGGHCLDAKFFGRFEHILAADPDPLAPFLFRKRLREAGVDTPVDWISSDLLHLTQTPQLTDTTLRHVLEQEGDCAVLFSNIVGQFLFLAPANPAEEELFLNRCRQVVREAIAGRSWASLHDRFSSFLPPTLSPRGIHTSQRLTDAEIARTLYSRRAPLKNPELHDHSVQGYFPETLPYTYLHWNLLPGWHHLIEAVCQASSGFR